ncbi:hypothetical protein COOONC_02928 [Cooperia oncophora]
MKPLIGLVLVLEGYMILSLELDPLLIPPESLTPQELEEEMTPEQKQMEELELKPNPENLVTEKQPPKIPKKQVQPLSSSEQPSKEKQTNEKLQKQEQINKNLTEQEPPENGTKVEEPQEKLDQEEEDEIVVEKPGPDDFLDEFAKEFVGHTVQEIQKAPWDSPAKKLQSDGNDLLKKLNKYIEESEVMGSDAYLILWHTQTELESLGYGIVTRSEVLDRLKRFWDSMEEDDRKEVLKEFPVFKMVDNAVKSEKELHKYY